MSYDQQVRQVPLTRRRIRLGRVVLVGAIANLVLLAAGVAIQLATSWTGIGAWLAAPLVGAVASLVDVGKQALTADPRAGNPASSQPGPVGPQTVPSPPPPDTRPAARRRSSRAPVIVGILVAVLVIGGGGALAAYGVSTLFAIVTGDQDGVPIQVGGPVSVDGGGIIGTVEGIEQTPQFTKVRFTAQNALGNSATLPLYGNATLSDSEGNTLSADPFRSEWNQTIGSGQLRRGVLVFPGRLPATATSASLSFATVYEQGFEGPDSLTVSGVPIAPPPE